MVQCNGVACGCPEAISVALVQHLPASSAAAAPGPFVWTATPQWHFSWLQTVVLCVVLTVASRA